MMALFTGCAAEGENPEAALLAKAREAFLTGEFFTSEGLYQNYLQTYPEGAERLEAWNRLFDISRNILRDNDKASNIMEAMILDYSFDPQVIPGIYERAAELYASMKDYERVVSIWNEYLDLPGLPPESVMRAMFEKSRALAHIGRGEEAIRGLEECAVSARNPEWRALCLSEKANLLLRREKPQEAWAVFEQLKDDAGLSAKDRALAAFSLAELMENQGQKKEALALYESILETYPNPNAVKSRIEYLRK